MNDSASRDFSDFYEQWFDRVYNYARHRTGSPVRADEIVSDTFSRVLQVWSRYDQARGDRQTWLFTIAFRAVADHYRLEKRRFWSPLELLPDPKEPGGGPPARAEQAQEQFQLAQALAQLDEQHREVVTLRFFAGMTNRAIAGLLGISESNVAVILFRSVRKMRKTLPGVEA